MKSGDLIETGQQLRGTSLYLVGMMGSGKTTVGRILGQRLGYGFFDTDHLIERLTGQAIATLFAQQGEPAFRDLETRVLAELGAYTRLVVATGGGIVLRPQNWSYLHHGIVVWLDVAAERLIQRLHQDSSARPLLQTPDPAATLRDILEQRRPLYAQADVQVQIAGSEPPEQVADWVWQQVQRRIRPLEDRILG